MSDSAAPAPTRRRSERFARGGLVAVLVFALVVRARGLGEWWLNPDEGIYYSILTRETFEGFWAEVAANAHPPLYYLILRGLGAVTWDFVWLRGFSVACGVAAVAAVAAAARELTRADTRSPAPVVAIEVSGLVAATMVALAPGLIELSQVMRPYMLQLALLAGALAFLLRHRREPTGASLGGYVACICLALLTHYSSVLGLAVLGCVTVADGVALARRKKPSPAASAVRAWQAMAAAHLASVALVAILWLVHLRPLAASALADDALNGWLAFYMIDSAYGAWLGLLGYQSLLAVGWLRAPLALLLLAVPLVALLDRARTPAVLGVGALAVAVGAAASGSYPFGATRHATWLIAFSIPALGWLSARWVASWAEVGVVDAQARPAGTHGRAPPTRTLAATIVVVAVVAAGGPIGAALGVERAPWAPTDRVLARADMARMIDVVDPVAEPELIVMGAQSFYLLLPFYPTERESATFSADSALFHFAYGGRRILVSRSWDLTADGDPREESDLVGTLARGARAFGGIELARREEAMLLVGGWRPPLVDQLTSKALSEPVTNGQRVVPGLLAFLLDLPALRRVFGDG